MESEENKDYKFDLNYLINNVPGGIAIYKLAEPLKLLYFNDGICGLTGHTREEYAEIVRDDGMNTVYKKDRPLLEAEVNAAVAENRKVDFTYRICHKTEGPIWVHLSAVNIGMEDGAPIYYAMFMDISDERKTQKLLKELAERDSLTGAFNRITFEKLIESHLQENMPFSSAFIMLDIDNFKQINDFLGHTKGDEVLWNISKLLVRTFGVNSIVARMGGDEFAVFIPTVRSHTKLLALIEQFRAASNIDYEYQGSRIHISCSLGIAFAPKDGDSYTALYANADKALLYAKNNGKNQYRFFGDVLASASPLLLRNMEWLLEESPNAIYICDSESYELLYMNKLGRRICGIQGNSYMGKKCYEELMHGDTPCLFCHMEDMRTDRFSEREYTMPQTGMKLLMKGKLINWNGIKAHVEFITILKQAEL